MGYKYGAHEGDSQASTSNATESHQANNQSFAVKTRSTKGLSPLVLKPDFKMKAPQDTSEARSDSVKSRSDKARPDFMVRKKNEWTSTMLSDSDLPKGDLPVSLFFSCQSTNVMK